MPAGPVAPQHDLHFPLQFALHFALHFTDSEVRYLRRDGADLLLAFAAAQVQPLAADGRAVHGTGPGHVRGLVLRLRQADAAALAGAWGDAIGRLAQGRLVRGGQALSTLVVPGVLDGPLRLVLDFANGTPFQADAQGLAAAFDGAPGYRESLAC